MDAGIGAQVLDGFPPLTRRGRFIGIGEVASETVPAIHGTRTGCDQKCAALVLMQYPGRAAGHQITDGIDGKAGRQLFFLGER